MKKVILGSVLAIVAAGASAATTNTFCSGASGTQTGTAFTPGTATDNNFVKVAFTPKCSSNIALAGSDGGIYYLVGSGSTKGKTSFKGGTGGGGIISHTACATTGCALSDATTAMAAGSSS